MSLANIVNASNVNAASYVSLIFAYMLTALVDECTINADNCDTQATCTDTDLSFTCACNQGYAGDGTSCTGKHISVEYINVQPTIALSLWVSCVYVQHL